MASGSDQLEALRQITSSRWAHWGLSHSGITQAAHLGVQHGQGHRGFSRRSETVMLVCLAVSLVPVVMMWLSARPARGAERRWWGGPHSGVLAMGDRDLHLLTPLPGHHHGAALVVRYPRRWS